MIQFSHVFKRYPGGFDALRNINLQIQSGEMVFITGPSGAGKSTLLKLITAIEQPTRGDAVVNGKNLLRLPRRRIPYFRREIGVVFQDHKLLFDRNVFDVLKRDADFYRDSGGGVTVSGLHRVDGELISPDQWVAAVEEAEAVA